MCRTAARISGQLSRLICIVPCRALPCRAVLCDVLQPIIYYFALATDADPIPFLTAMFTAANIWSMLLFVGEWRHAAYTPDCPKRACHRPARCWHAV
jgi:hypothetical protein